MLRPVALAVGLWALPALAVETVRILMEEREGAVTLHASAPLSAGEDRAGAAFQPLGKQAVTVRRTARGGLELDGAPAPADPVRFRAGAGGGADGGGPGEEPVSVGELTVRGDVVARVRGQRVQLINVLPLETYLAAVLGSEMPRDFPPEALKAQAVAARTYALHKKLEAYGQAVHMGASVLHQVYAGLSREDERTRAAVLATTGEVLTFELQPIEAYFHASCGGRTESGMAALGRDLPYLASVECPCVGLPSSRWALTLPAPELRQAIPGASTLQVLSRSRTGRARLVRVAPDRVLDAVLVRQRLGYLKLRSLDFEVAGAEGALRIEGRGFGHGAGLCQWGAKVLADQGQDYRAILRHYYPGAELQALY